MTPMQHSRVFPHGCKPSVGPVGYARGESMGPCTCTPRKWMEARRSPCRRSGTRRTRRVPRSMRPYPHSAEDRLPSGRPGGGLPCCQGPHHGAILVQTRDMEGRLRLVRKGHHDRIAVHGCVHQAHGRTGCRCRHRGRVAFVMTSLPLRGYWGLGATVRQPPGHCWT